MRAKRRRDRKAIASFQQDLQARRRQAPARPQVAPEEQQQEEEDEESQRVEDGLRVEVDGQRVEVRPTAGNLEARMAGHRSPGSLAPPHLWRSACLGLPVCRMSSRRLWARSGSNPDLPEELRGAGRWRDSVTRASTCPTGPRTLTVSGGEWPALCPAAEGGWA